MYLIKNLLIRDFFNHSTPKIKLNMNLAKNNKKRNLTAYIAQYYMHYFFSSSHVLVYKPLISALVSVMVVVFWAKRLTRRNVSELELFFFLSGVPQRLDAGDLGRPTRYCYLKSIYHAWDGGHRSPGLPSVPSHSVCSRPGWASLSRRHW